MSTMVTSPVSPKRAEWQPGHIPRLSYRNPIPADESLPEHNNTKVNKKTAVPALSIREIREALPREKTPVSSPTTAQPQKGKKSFLGNIFAKEPSMAALDQATQQMMQQHNATSTKAIPYISQQKMPNHVPKVNSKWDGVPEYVKTREKQEKERAKAARRISLLPTVSRSRSGEIEQHVPRQRRSSNEGSTAESWDSRSTDSRPMFQDGMSVRPTSIYSTSSNGSVTLASRPFSGKSQSSGSFSGTRSMDVYSPYPDETYSLPNGLRRLTSAQSTSTKATTSTGHSRSDRSPHIRMSTIAADAIPDYTFSPIETPLESSPRTPGFFPVDDVSLDAQILKERHLSPVRSPIMPVSVGAKKSVKRSGRVDVHLNMVDRASAAPWEAYQLPNENTKDIQSSHGKGRATGKGKR